MPLAAAAKLNKPGLFLANFAIVRRSIDTRDRPRIYWSFAVEFDGNEELIAHLPPNEAGVAATPVEEPVVPGPAALSAKPVVVGAGPAGLFAARTLAEHGYRPIVVERGREIAVRDEDVGCLMRGDGLDPESNLLFGEGGAGAYSDGKLTTRVSDARLARVLEAFVECGAPESILIDARPHIGSDLLPGVVARLRRKIESAGGEFAFGFKVSDFAVTPGRRVDGVHAADGRVLPAGLVVLATGASARDVYETLLARGVTLERKPFQIGVRIEHPQAVIDRAVYRRERDDLPPAEYIISCPAAGGRRGVASFCMCPGGVIVPAMSEPRHLCTNGMSGSARAGRFANSALVVTVTPEDIPHGGPLAGVHFQSDLERAAFEVAGDYRAPAQTAKAFLAGRATLHLPQSSYPLGLAPTDLRRLLPDFLTQSLKACLPDFDAKMRGFIEKGLLVGVEARVSSPVRITRDRDSRESVSMAGLYPVGEGAGYAGGIMTSAVDGIKTAEAIIRRYAPLTRPAAPR